MANSHQSPPSHIIALRGGTTGKFQMQGDKNWILPKEMNANRFFWDSHWLEIWSNNLFPSMGPKRGIVAKDSDCYGSFPTHHISRYYQTISIIIEYLKRLNRINGSLSALFID
jgi:hypothetical protein